MALDLETLKRVKFLFELHSDSSCDTNGYRSLLDLIKQTEEALTIPDVSNNEVKCCPHCGKCSMNYDSDGSYLNWECKTLP